MISQCPIWPDFFSKTCGSGILAHGKHCFKNPIDTKYAIMLISTTEESFMRIVSRNAKLTPAQVRKARKLWQSRKKSQKEIAEMFGVSQPTISNVLTGRVYRKVA